MKRRKIENSRDGEGFISLDKLKHYIEKGAIVEGTNAKKWFNVNGERFVFKEYDGILPCFGEVLYYEAAKMCGVDCAEYDFAKYEGNVGTISYDFLNNDEVYYNFLELTSQFGDTNFDLDNIASNHDLLIIQNNRYNNLNSIRDLLGKLFHVSREEKKVMNTKLIEMFTLDTLFWHCDRTLWNYGVAINEESDDVRFAQLHDNSYVLCLHKGEQYIEDAIVDFINGGVMGSAKGAFESFAIFDGDDSIEQLISFYSNSNEETRKIIDDIISKIDVDELVEKVQKRCKIRDIPLLWIKAVLNFRKKTISRGIESVKINDDEAQMPNVTFSKRK